MNVSPFGLAVSLSLFCQYALAAACNDFAVTPQASIGETTYTQPSLRTFIVSSGVTCQSTSGDCTIPITAFVTDHRSLNLTTIVPDESSIYDLITSKTSIEFLDTLTGNLSSVTSWPIRNGTSGHVGFTPNHRCVQGTLLDCHDKNLQGFAVEACTPYSNTGESISGTMTNIVTSKEEADALTCNPANSTAARNGEDPPVGCDETEERDGEKEGDQKSGAGKSAVSSFSVTSLVLAAMMFFVV